MDFEQTLAGLNLDLRPVSIETLQVNLGKLCNQACKHCHVDAGPKRTEMMTTEAVMMTMTMVVLDKLVEKKCVKS